MKPLEIVLAVVVFAAVLIAVFAIIVRKAKKGGGCCDGTHCTDCKHCGAKQNKNTLKKE